MSEPLTSDQHRWRPGYKRHWRWVCWLLGHDREYLQPNGLDWTWKCRRCAGWWWQYGG